MKNVMVHRHLLKITYVLSVMVGGCQMRNAQRVINVQRDFTPRTENVKDVVGENGLELGQGNVLRVLVEKLTH